MLFYQVVETLEAFLQSVEMLTFFYKVAAMLDAFLQSS